MASIADKIAAVKSGLDTVLGIIDGKLRNKVDKSAVYTKTETDDRIQALIGAAPAALDTLTELAAALNDDPDFAGTVTAALAKKANSADVYDRLSADQTFLATDATAENSRQLGGNAPDYYATQTAHNELMASVESALDALSASLNAGAELINGIPS